MSKVYTDPQNYTNIAAAIRAKNGSSETYKPSEMPAAIRAIETDPNIQALTVTENGTYTAPSGVDGYSPVTVNVPAEIESITITQNGTYTAPSGTDGYSPITVNVSGGGGGARVNLHFPRVCIGDPRVDIHSDCELKDTVSIADAEADDAFTSFVRTDELDAYSELDQIDATAGSAIKFKLKSAGFAYNNGDSEEASVLVNALDFYDLYEVPSTSAWAVRKVLYRMTAVRDKSKTDSGTDTITFETPFRRVGGYANADTANVVLAGDSIVTCGALKINVNQRDGAMYSNWKEEGTVQGMHFLKIRWQGMSNYSGTEPDQEYEVIFLGNGDVIFHLIKKGAYSGTTTFYGTTFPCDETVPTVSFYRDDAYGGSWTIVQDAYSISSHSTEADLSWKQRTFATEYSNITHGAHLIHNVGYDDNSLTYTFLLDFMWHNKTYVNVNGNSWIGIGSTSEDIKMDRRDSKMWYLYADYTILTDKNDLKALHITWIGASIYSGTTDRYWALWLFENGDAMIYISTRGSNTGTSTFMNQTYTTADNSCISFYYDSTASNYDIKYETYTLEHHIG